MMRTLIAASLIISMATPALGFGGKLRDQHWLTHDAASAERIDHSDWDGLLKRYIRQDKGLGLNRFDYGAVTQDDRALLDDYIASLEDVEVTSLSRPAQMAFWMNLYNAYTIQVILDDYPLDSIRDIGGIIFVPDGPWSDTDYTVEVEGRELTLDHIEHGILRPIFEDPRVHYGVNCASVGCPNLSDTAFTADNVDDLLSANAQAFIASPRGLQDVTRRGAKVSSIYEWFKEDFGGDDAGVIAHLKAYGGADVVARLDGVARVAGHSYNWKLNDAEQNRY